MTESLIRDLYRKAHIFLYCLLGMIQFKFKWVYRRKKLSSHSTVNLDIQLSWLFATRNDSYCGNPVERLVASLKVLIHYLVEYDMSDISEIIVIDWNSSPCITNNSLFKDLIGFCQNLDRRVNLKVLSVPPDIASKYVNNRGPLSEVHAYNAAARRASGEMLLRLDQDSMVGRPFFDWLKTEKMNRWPHSKNIWWVGRRESAEDEYGQLIEDPIAFIEERLAQLKLYDNRAYTSPHGAVGVMMIPKQLWHLSRGYDESLTGWGHMELELLNYRLRWVERIVYLNIYLSISNPCCHIFHTDPSVFRSINPLALKFKFTPNLQWGLKDESLDLISFGEN